MIDLETCIRNVPDFPQKGIIFKDITPLLANHKAFNQAVTAMTEPFIGKAIQVVAAVESRGFIFGTLIADRLKAGFVPIRKPGKLPAETISESYQLEYGSNKVEIHADAILPGQKVLLVDDLLATGGTVGAAAKLVNKLGGKIVAAAFLIELSFLKGRDKLKGIDVHSIIKVS